MLLVGASASAREAAFIGGLSSPRLWNLDAAAAAATKAHSRDASSRPATLRTCRSRREAVGLAACSMSAMLPFVAAHGPSMIVTAKAAAVQAVALATGTWIGLVLWTLLNMAVYTVRRAYLHGLTKRLVLCRHFINGYDEPPHPYFAVSPARISCMKPAIVPCRPRLSPRRSSRALAAAACSGLSARSVTCAHSDMLTTCA
jgi:hypothetical protein